MHSWTDLALILWRTVTRKLMNRWNCQVRPTLISTVAEVGSLSMRTGLSITAIIWWHLFTQSACCHVSSSHSYRVIYGHFHLAIFISMNCCAFFIHRKCSKAESLFDCFDPWENTTHSSLRGLILGLFEFILKADQSFFVRVLWDGF